MLSLKRCSRSVEDEEASSCLFTEATVPKRVKHEQTSVYREEPGGYADATLVAHKVPPKAKGVHFRNGLTEIVVGDDDDQLNRTAVERDLCWYTTKDYILFMRERLDTARVYQSVAGDLSHLQEFYTVRGLEHLLELRQYLAMQRSQRGVLSGVIEAQRRNVSVEGIRQISLEWSTGSVARALSRAAPIEAVTEATSPMQLSKAKRHRRVSSPSVAVRTPSSVAHHVTPPMALLSRRRVPVDVEYLRAMNARLLRQQRPHLVTPNLTSADTTRRILLQAALNVPFPGIQDESFP